MLFILFLFGLALGAVTPADDRQVKLLRGSCPAFWFSFNGRCYKYTATHLSWADAELFCVSEGANLVSIHSAAEQTFIRSLIHNFDHAGGPTWIGLSDIHKERRWMWSDGSAFDYSFWSKNEPNNAGYEHCVHNNFADGKWNDVQCSSTLPSICATHITCS